MTTADDDLREEMAGIDRVTLSAGEQSVSMTPQDFHRAVERIAGDADTGTADPEGVVELGAHEQYPVPAEDRFRGEYLDAPDLEALAEVVIERHRMDAPEMWHIRYLWKAEATKAAMGKCIKASGPLQHLTQADFVIWIAADIPRAESYTRHQVEAVLYHELLHVSVRTDKDGHEHPAVRDHDAEVFREELRDYGLYDATLQRTFGQLEFPF